MVMVFVRCSVWVYFKGVSITITNMESNWRDLLYWWTTCISDFNEKIRDIENNLALNLYHSLTMKKGKFMTGKIKANSFFTNKKSTCPIKKKEYSSYNKTAISKLTPTRQGKLLYSCMMLPYSLLCRGSDAK